MDNTQIIILLAIIIFFVVKHLKQVSAAKARELLAAGATIIDVRTPEEFASGHLHAAINLPLDTISARIGETCPDKEKPLLLYCLSGTRSAIATSTLRSRQYTQAHNLGSIYRARAILK